MFVQVDYSKDEQWHVWNQDALKRFLNRTDHQHSEEKFNMQNNGQGHVLASEPKFESPKGPWWPSSKTPAENTTPLSLEEKPALFGLESAFAEGNQEVSLGNDMWDLATVSA